MVLDVIICVALKVSSEIVFPVCDLKLETGQLNWSKVIIRVDGKQPDLLIC